MKNNSGVEDDSNKRKKGKKPNNKTDKSSRRKKSFREVWRSSSRVRQWEFIIAVLAATGVVGYLIAYIAVSLKQTVQFEMQHMPLLINSHPPEFLQPFVCDAKNGFRTGNMQTFVKNIGNASAYHVAPYMNIMKVIPEKKTGDALTDALPSASCDMKINMGETEFPLAPGIEIRPQMRQSVMSLPPLASDEPVQLYLASCIYYSDEYGGRHGTCDTYRLNLASTSPLDTLQGSPTFFCDAAPKTGKFFGHLTGHCQK